MLYLSFVCQCFSLLWIIFGFALATFHGSDGEVTVSAASYAPLAKYFVKAAEEMGYPTVDLNSPYQEGIYEENVYHC